MESEARDGTEDLFGFCLVRANSFFRARAWLGNPTKMDTDRDKIKDFSFPAQTMPVRALSTSTSGDLGASSCPVLVFLSDLIAIVDYCWFRLFRLRLRWMGELTSTEFFPLARELVGLAPPWN